MVCRSRSNNSRALFDVKRDGDSDQPRHFERALSLSKENNEANRYEILKKLSTMLRSPIISYMENLNAEAELSDQDCRYLTEMINNIDTSQKSIHVILQSNGGYPDAAYKYSTMFKAMFPKSFNVIVPMAARSAATMFVLGADQLILGPSSEIGPVDPLMQSYGTTNCLIPAKDFLNSMSDLINKCAEETDPNKRKTYMARLRRMDPVFAKNCEESIRSATIISHELLRNGLMRGSSDGQIKDAIRELIAGDRYVRHSNIITPKAAKDIGLNTEIWDMQDERWQLLWEYYSLVEELFRSNGRETVAKLFEVNGYTLTHKHELEGSGKAKEQEPATEQPNN